MAGLALGAAGAAQAQRLDGAEGHQAGDQGQSEELEIIHSCALRTDGSWSKGMQKHFALVCPAKISNFETGSLKRLQTTVRLAVTHLTKPSNETAKRASSSLIYQTIGPPRSRCLPSSVCVHRASGSRSSSGRGKCRAGRNKCELFSDCLHVCRHAGTPAPEMQKMCDANEVWGAIERRADKLSKFYMHSARENQTRQA